MNSPESSETQQNDRLLPLTRLVALVIIPFLLVAPAILYLASRMESQGEPGKIQISSATQQLLPGDFVCQWRGWIDVKDRDQMETWFLEAVKP